MPGTPVSGGTDDEEPWLLDDATEDELACDELEALATSVMVVLFTVSVPAAVVPAPMPFAG